MMEHSEILSRTYKIFFSSFILLIIMTIYYLYGNINNHKHEKNEKIYYFDSNSTTQIHDDDVKKTIIKWLNCGNPSNVLHSLGLKAHNHIEYCRHHIARKMNVIPEEIYFTSGATESNNIFIQGVMNYYLNLKNTSDNKYTIISSSFEHPSVSNIFNFYKQNPLFNIIEIDPVINSDHEYFGCIDPEDIEKKILENQKYKIIMISVMHGNNETGSIQNINAIGEISKKYNIIFHTDATQTIGKYMIHPKKYNISSLSFSGHKFYCPKGIGVMYVDSNVKFLNLCHGGSQEYKKRPGTENVAFISGLTMAFDKVHIDRDIKNKNMLSLKMWILNNLNKHNIEIIGPYKKNAMPNTILVIFKNMKMCNKIFVQYLNKFNICISVGSACQTSHQNQSHVLISMKVNPQYYNNIVRISLSDYTTMEECKYFCKIVDKILYNE